MVELLSPAGNMEKLKSAILFGADAVYLAGQAFGMRVAANNFTLEELKEAVSFAHERGKKVYLTVNTMPHEHQYTALRAYLSSLKDIPLDALIIGDIGVLMTVKELLPKMAIHISTQANVLSVASCLAFYALGAKRIVLARELTLENIKAIRKALPKELELECFIHGSMCISYSGRCLLSSFFTDRDANLGGCTQPCRWNYHVNMTVTEEKRPDLPLALEEIDGETFTMSSKDTCMIEHIPELMAAGINSFKIEGRMKSAYYTGVVTNTYRMALDAFLSGEYLYNPLWKRELACVSHRPYATGYYFSDPRHDANTTQDLGYFNEKAFLAQVLDYDEKTGLATLQQKNKQCLEEPLEVLTPGKTGVAFQAEFLLDENGNQITATPHAGMIFQLKTPVPMKCGDIVRKYLP